MFEIFKNFGLHHATSVYKVDKFHDGFKVRILFLKNPNGQVEVFWRLFDYFCANPLRSTSWQNITARSLGLLWDYFYVTKKSSYPSNKNISFSLLIKDFLNALLTGTYKGDGTDLTGLYWTSSSVDIVKRFATAIDSFIVWMADDEGHTDLGYTFSSSGISLKSFSLSLKLARHQNISLLGHLFNRNNITHRKKYIETPDPFGYHSSPAIYFPVNHFEKLLWDGYTIQGRKHFDHLDFRKYNIRNMMICLLQAQGGCRVSEPFHLFVHDVIEDPTKPEHSKVILYHPSESFISIFDKSTGKQKQIKRSDYLKLVYGLIPRNWEHKGPYKAGWKNLKLNDNGYADIFWLDDNAAFMFWLLYKIYVVHVRKPIIEKRLALGGNNHPFLFVSSKGNPNKTGLKSLPGAPYSIEQYEKAHKRAVAKINLPYSKNYGTTTHGLRHYYGHALTEAGIKAKIIQECLHHRSIFSQGIYTVPSASSINRIIKKAKNNFGSSNIFNMPMTSNFIDSTLLTRGL